MGTALFNEFSDDYIVGEFNEIPWQKIGDRGYYGPGGPGKRLGGPDDWPIRFCAVSVLACTWFPKVFVAYPPVIAYPYCISLRAT